MKYFVLAVCLFFTSTVSVFAQSLEGVQAMEIKSPAFSSGSMIPKKYTCQGENINPALTVSGVPAGTKSLALIVDDPDAPAGDWVHWLLFNIPVTNEIRENSVPGLEGANSFGDVKYGGPCPPSGVHRYFFKLYALDVLLTLTKGVTKAELEKALAEHVLAKAELFGIYKKQ